MRNGIVDMGKEIVRRIHFKRQDLVVFPEDLECTWKVQEAVTKYYNFG